MATVLLVLVAMLVAANIVATIVCVRSPALTRLQKRLQLCVIWFIPAIGAFSVLLLHRLDRRPVTPGSSAEGLDGSEIEIGRGTNHGDGD